MTIQNEIFRMSMEAREKQKQKTQARHDQGIRRSTNNIMNTKQITQVYLVQTLIHFKQKCIKTQRNKWKETKE